jgi:hypothetical protein
MSGARHWKGNRVERDIVSRHKALGIHAERYPLSGASRFRGGGHDVDIYLFRRDEAPAVAEVKGRKTGLGFATLGRWLSNYDPPLLRRNADALVLLPRMLERVRHPKRVCGVRSMTDLLARLNGVLRSGDGWTARCPARDRRCLIKCHAGCEWEAGANTAWLHRDCRAAWVADRDLDIRSYLDGRGAQ